MGCWLDWERLPRRRVSEAFRGVRRHGSLTGAESLLKGILGLADCPAAGTCGRGEAGVVVARA